MKNKCLFIFIFLVLTGRTFSQEQEWETTEGFEPKHSIGLTIGHEHSFEGRDADGKKKTLALPFWGLDYNFQFAPTFAIGLHTDFVLESFKIIKNEGSEEEEELKRSRPVAPAIMILYRPATHWSFGLGMGGEFAKEESYALNRLASKPRKGLKPPSVRQQAIRAKMALVGGYLKPLKEMIYLGFAASYKVKSKTAAMNMAVAHAMHKAIGGTYPDLYIKPEQVVLSRGKVPKLWKPEVQLQGKQLQVIWRPLTNFCSFGDDRVYVLAYNVAAKTVAVGEATRESVKIDLQTEPPESTLHLYVCVSSRDGKFFSDSEYFGAYKL